MLGLLGGISTSAYLALEPVGVVVLGIGLVALLGFLALAVFLFVIRAIG